MAHRGAVRVTGPRIVARLLVAAPATTEDADAVAALLRTYAPTALHRLDGAVAGDVEHAVASALGLACSPVEGSDALQTIEALASRALGGCVAVLVPGALLPTLLARALGAPPQAAARIAAVSRAISVLECDDEGRWSVVRLNEGAFPLPPA